MSFHSGGRPLARSRASQFLSQAEPTPLGGEEVRGKDYVTERAPRDDSARQLALGADAARHDLDAVIASRSVTWTLRRMPSMDRNLLRLAIYEMLFVDEVEIPVTINESVELAKAYGTDESAKFINGLLASIAKSIDAGHDLVAEFGRPAAESETADYDEVAGHDGDDYGYDDACEPQTDGE